MSDIQTSVGVPWAAWRGADDAVPVPVPDTSMLPQAAEPAEPPASTAWDERARATVRASPLGSVAVAFALGALMALMARLARIER